jgi:hypothetical protein
MNGRLKSPGLGRIVQNLLNLTILSAMCVLLAGHRPDVMEPAVPSVAFAATDGTAMLASASTSAGTQSTAAAYLEYPQQNGYIHNWLVAGPQTISVPDADRFTGKALERQIARRYHRASSGIVQAPVERASFQVDDAELTWLYYKCLDDHFVELSDTYHDLSYLRTWAYAQVTSSLSRQVTFYLTTTGPADLWLNGQHVLRQGHFYEQPHSVSFQGWLRSGRNEVLVRFEEVSARQTPYVMALQIAGSPPLPDLRVSVPTDIENVARRQMFERVFDQAYLERDVSYKGVDIVLRWAEDLDAVAPFLLRLQSPQDRIQAEIWDLAVPSGGVSVAPQVVRKEGDYDVVLLPDGYEYLWHKLRYRRHIPVQVVDNAYSEIPYGTYAERRVEALVDAARRESDLYSEIAKMELGWWPKVSIDRMLETLYEIDQPGEGRDAYVVGLLGAMHRYQDDPNFQEIGHSLEEFVLNSAYWLSKGNHAALSTGKGQRTLFYTSQILAGQLYPDRTFAGTRHTGRWLWKQGEVSWLRERASDDSFAWDTHCFLSEDVVALSHLVDLAENTIVRELATAVLDRALFSLARNSFRGVYGSPHRRICASMNRSGRLEATSGISRLLWGMGIYNRHIGGTVSLASSTYEMPRATLDVATDLYEEMHNRGRHAGDARGSRFWRPHSSEVNVVTYKTPDYMLSSVQDHRPGERGDLEHIWQATLGPDALVYVNHPANSGEGSPYRPGFWQGNAVLPRVAQWKDTLIAFHKLPEDDWMGFTHAYLPVNAFDEYVMQDDWVFARRGDGYLALTAAQGIELITHGPSAYRELRSYGRENAWLCLMGRAAIDGSFGAFQKAVLALDVDVQGSSVRLSTLRGETLSLGWGR